MDHTPQLQDSAQAANEAMRFAVTITATASVLAGLLEEMTSASVEVSQSRARHVD